MFAMPVPHIIYCQNKGGQFTKLLRCKIFNGKTFADVEIKEAGHED